MTSNNTLKIICATCEEFNLIYDGLENYFIFYDGEEVGGTINDITTPKELLHIANTKSFNDMETTETNPTIKGLINAISLKYDKPHQKLRLLKQILNDLFNVIEDDSLYMIHFKKAPRPVRDFITNLNKDYGYDNTLFGDDDNLGNAEDFNLLFESGYNNNWYIVNNTIRLIKSIFNYSYCQ